VPAVVIAAVGMFVALLLLLAAVTVPDTPGSSPSPTASASPSASASPRPTPTPVRLTASEAVDAFKDLVDGEEEGLIDSEAAEDLHDLADEIASALEDGAQGKINRGLRDLRRAIDEFDRDGSIDSDMAARLQDAVDEIEAAAAR
jgi:ABC-type transporter Mla subunit MlaD